MPIFRDGLFGRRLRKHPPPGLSTTSRGLSPTAGATGVPPSSAAAGLGTRLERPGTPITQPNVPPGAAAPRPGVLTPGVLPHPAPPPDVDPPGYPAPDVPSQDRDTRMAPLEMPPILQEIISTFEEWAQTNAQDEKSDRRRFWVLKIPAILTASAAGLLALFNVEVVDAVLAFIGAACVTLDSIMKPGKLRSVHWRAVHDLRRIQHELRYVWNARSLALAENAKPEDERQIAAELVDFARREHIRVHDYLVDAETAM